MTAGTLVDRTLPPPPEPEWDPPPDPDLHDIGRLERELSLPAVLCRILVARGFREPSDAKRFLRPRLEALHPPSALVDLDRAVERIRVAIRARETILVHGDYDVDGICAAALLTRWIRRLGGTAEPFVPHRLNDGYDLGPAGVAAAERHGASLIVTCDSGILAHAAIARASAADIDVIVTDHHTPGDSLPAAFAVVNPNRTDNHDLASELCGTGVVFKLCQGLAAAESIAADELWEDLDLVALATVADLVPLTGENRILVRFGLRYLAHTTKPGLRALFESAGLTDRAELDAGQIAFVLAPRINAVGRLGDPTDALRLLLTEDAAEAGRLSSVLDEVNRLRKEEDRATEAAALERLAEAFDPARDFGVVLAGEGWHPGVIGIVASRLVERIHRPVVMIALDGVRGRGSARSIPAVHVLDAIRAGGEHLERFGGHRQAAGLDVSTERIPQFRAAFNESVRGQLDGRLSRPRLRTDVAISLVDADDDLHRYLEHAGPFGIGNPRPVFCMRGVELSGRPRIVGDGHLKIRLKDGEHEIEAIGFRLATRIPPDSLVGHRLEALFHLRENEFRGVRSLQARLIDLRPVHPMPVSGGIESGAGSPRVC